MSCKISNIDLNVARKVTKDKAIKYQILPYKEDKNRLYVLSCEENIEDRQDIDFILGKEIVEEFIDITLLNKLTNSVFVGIENNYEEVIINNSIKNKASDIHFEPRKDCVVVRERVDGNLRVAYLLTYNEYIPLISKIKIKSSLDITEKRKPQDGKFSYDYLERSYDIRVSTTNTIFGEKVVLRIIYGDVFKYSLRNLGLTIKQIEKLNKLISLKTGLIIVNGPTGSGKSTTMYTILNMLNKENVNITTIEDPVEVMLNGINQISLSRAIDLDFSSGLRSILRQDPDIIMIGEIRDNETAIHASKAALTGHKVISTIHTKDPREVYFRLEDMGVKNYLIRDSLVGIISQRLIRVLCEDCKEEKGTITLNNKEIKLFEAVGCGKCSGTGYYGRQLVAAIHYINKELKQKLKTIYTDNTLLSNNEMIENLYDLLLKGKITHKDYIDFIEVEELEG